MARKPRSTSEPTAAAAPAAKASDFILMPPTSTIKSLKIERAKALKTSRNAIGAYGAELADKVEKKHVDKKALGIAFALDDLPDEKLAITLPHLLRYIDDLGLAERATRQQELFVEQADQPGEGESNVTHIGAAARRVAEAAGADA